VTNGTGMFALDHHHRSRK